MLWGPSQDPQEVDLNAPLSIDGFIFTRTSGELGQGIYPTLSQHQVIQYKSCLPQVLCRVSSPLSRKATVTLTVACGTAGLLGCLPALGSCSYIFCFMPSSHESCGAGPRGSPCYGGRRAAQTLSSVLPTSSLCSMAPATQISCAQFPDSR